MKLRKYGGLWILAGGMVFSLVVPVRAWAHGERSIMPVLRMRTVQFYDVEWDKTQIAVNEEVRIRGKFHLMEYWPENVGKPTRAYFNVAIPGPRLIRVEQRINGVPVFNHMEFQLGREYSFETVLRGRQPGRWHIHPMINGEKAGPMPGPGQWVEVTGNFADFRDPVKLLTGEVIDLHTYGLSTVRFWHYLWVAVALFWLVWWLRRPSFIPRYRMLQQGDEASLILPSDRTLGVVVLVGTILIVALGVAVTLGKYYRTSVPLNADIHYIDPLPSEVSESIRIEPVKASYSVPERSIKLKVRITNNHSEPIRFSEFSTVGVRFIESSLLGNYPLGQNYPEELVAKNGLVVSPKNTVGPGETAEFDLDMTDAVWATEQLIDLATAAGTSVAGLFFFHDASGKRHMVPFFTPIVPVF